MDKIRVGIVNYLNTRPLLKGLAQLALDGDILLTQHYPAQIAEDLILGKIDVGLVPVAVIPQLKEGRIIGSHCIATTGTVASVCLFSELPIEKLETIYLDYQSRTSVRLLQILLRDFWKKEVAFISPTSSAYIDKIEGTSGGLIIGDRALNAHSRFSFRYDLGEAWQQLTGLPFVFAVWIAVSPLEDSFVSKFTRANEFGMNNRAAIAAENTGLVTYDLYQYFTTNIDYQLTDQKRKALDYFLSLCATLPPLPLIPEPKNV
ncbi:MAG: menaquinone biosynthetic enzyme MqnA/MqnD family protein [Bacteroidota bacterium]|nr:menaquinone biosynthesis protein [Bacteroidota bacterium]